MADRAAATARSAVCPIAGRPAAQTTWGRCLLACAPDLREGESGCLYEPVFLRLVRGLSLPLRRFLTVSSSVQKGVTWDFMGSNGNFWDQPARYCDKAGLKTLSGGQYPQNPDKPR